MHSIVIIDVNDPLCLEAFVDVVFFLTELILVLLKSFEVGLRSGYSSKHVFYLSYISYPDFNPIYGEILL